MILDSKVGALDRSLGFVFGAARGLLLCAVAFVFVNWLMPDKSQPDWMKNAKMKPLLAVTGDQIMAFLPDDPEGILARFKKKGVAPSEDAPAETDQDAKPPASAPAAKPAPAKRTDATPSLDRKAMDALATGATAPSRR